MEKEEQLKVLKTFNEILREGAFEADLEDVKRSIEDSLKDGADVSMCISKGICYSNSLISRLKLLEIGLTQIDN